MPILRPRILAHHLVLSGYGFWLANDPRGSGSPELRVQKFADLGPIHPRRKRLQPSRAELREFYRNATPRLEHKPIWFDERMRQRIGTIFDAVITRSGYTVWACSAGSNHAHLCVRVHRDSYQTMWEKLTAQVRTTFVAEGLVDAAHPLWADRPYSVYLHSPEDIARVVEYIAENPTKEGLTQQAWGFVRSYDGWPERRAVRDDASGGREGERRS